MFSLILSSDLKKTMAVLLENVLDRLNVLEDKVKMLVGNQSSLSNTGGLQSPNQSVTASTENQKPVNAKGLMINCLTYVIMYFYFKLKHCSIEMRIWYSFKCNKILVIKVHYNLVHLHYL